MDIRLEGVTPSQLPQSILRHGTKLGAEAFNLVLNGYHSFLILFWIMILLSFLFESLAYISPPNLFLPGVLL